MMLRAVRGLVANGALRRATLAIGTSTAAVPINRVAALTGSVRQAARGARFASSSAADCTNEDIDVRTYELPSALTDQLLTPSLVVYMPFVRSNISRMLRHIAESPVCNSSGQPPASHWRPHVKTTKTPEVWEELLAKGVTQFKCATTREAHVLTSTILNSSNARGAGDVLVAYPHVGPALTRLGQIADGLDGSQVRLSVLCEDPTVAREVPRAVGVWVDVNSGMNRTGVPLEQRERVLAVARAALDRGGAGFCGLHFYDGHQHDADQAARRRAIHGAYDALLDLVAFLKAHGVDVPQLVTSGTPACLHALAYARFVTDKRMKGTRYQISPGTVVFHDVRSKAENPALDLAPAALLLSRVVSLPDARTATCDAGTKSFAAEVDPPGVSVLGHPQLLAARSSEEHLPLRLRQAQNSEAASSASSSASSSSSSSAELPARGTLLYLWPQHICPTVNLHEACLLVDSETEKGTEKGTEKAPGERWTKWRLVPVAARAHECTLAPAPAPGAAGAAAANK